ASNYSELDDEYELDYEIHLKQRPQQKPGRRLKRTGSQMRAEIAQRDAVKAYNGVGAGSNGRKPGPSGKENGLLLVEEDRSKSSFSPSIASMSTGKNHVSKHESEWILNYLGNFYEEHLITDVIRRVKGGKEATVYCCRGHESTGMNLIAGKVYHEREFRSLKNDAQYRQGRTLLDIEGKRVRGKREARAMYRKTGFGKELLHTAWLSSEFGTLNKLHALGADVPRPVSQNDNAILMEYVGDEVSAAPALNHVSLSKSEARPLFDRLIYNIGLMLANDVIHGDLSAYNVLYWEGKIKIIDFPQAVNPYVNPDAYMLLERDVKRICQYFGRFGVQAEPVALTREIWAQNIPT
ncbi:MAG TPA: RIO1 family regulatory kinase/ATPase, partial [Chloroflexia bacterium]|nr:RIO1 family regulatory kinase/ATPase [Chloroflexia bacterium]